jgi:hypothetical protein
MIAWAGIVLALAFVGVFLNIAFGTRFELILHDIILFLVTLGMLFRIRFKTKEGEKEKLLKSLPTGELEEVQAEA